MEVFVITNRSKKKRLPIIIGILGLVAFVAAPFVTIYFLNNGNPYHKYLVNKYIPQHLEEAGYTDSDIQWQSYAQPKHTISKEVYHGHYAVTFHDEPDLQYYYGVTKKGKNVVQFCSKHHASGESITTETKHSEKDCIDQFSNR